MKQKKRMKPHQVWITIGFMIWVAFPLPAVLIELVPESLRNIFSAVILLLLFVGTPTCFILSLAVYRLTKQNTPITAKAILRALTPAQFLLFGAVFVYSITLLWYRFDSFQIGGVLTMCSFVLLGAAVIAAAVRWGTETSRSKREAAQRRSASQAAHKLDEESRYVSCTGCDKRLRNNSTVKKVDGRYYCKDCYQKLLSDFRLFKSSEKAKGSSSRFCAKCAKKLSGDNIPRLGNRYYCDACYQQLDDKYRNYKAWKNGWPQGGPTKRVPTPSPPPKNRVCDKCAKPLPDTDSVPHMGNRYYCDACYQQLRKKYLQFKTGKTDVQIRQEFVGVMHALLEKQIDIWDAEERKRIAEEQVYRSVCSFCGAERPSSAFHLVDNLLCCDACFDQLYTFDTDTEGDRTMGLFRKNKKKNKHTVMPDSQTAYASFDRDAFTDMFKPIIAPRLPADMQDVDTQRRLLANLKQVFPTVEPMLVAERELAAMEHGALDRRIGIATIASKVNGMLGVSVMDAVSADWDGVTTEQLLDAYILLDFYAFVLTPDAGVHLSRARACTGVALQKRLPQGTAANSAAYGDASALSGKYADGIDYVLQSRPEDDIFFVEIHDHTGRYLPTGADSPGMMGYAAFALTEEEYNRKAVHNDAGGMNELVGKLLEMLPKDRLIATGAVHPLTHERKGFLELDLKNETMDDGTYPKFRNARAIPYLRSLDRIYVTFRRVTGDQIPSVDLQGYAWLFSKKEYADAAMQRNADIDLFCKAFDQKELQAFVSTWYRCGVTRFRLNPGTNDRYAEVERDDFLPMEGVRKWDIVGSSLSQAIIRFRQYNAVRNDPDAQAMAMTMWSHICHELYRSVFLVPFVYDGEPDTAEDWIIHVTQAGAQRLTQAELDRQLGEKTAADNSLIARDQNDQPIYMLRKELLYGSEKYHFAGEGEAAPGKIMHLRTVLSDGKSFLCGFTDFAALHAVFGEHVRVAVMTYEEILTRLSDDLPDGSSILGMVVNPGGVELMLSRENIEFAAKEKDEPLKLYMPKNTSEKS